jgi:hypothetical protein
MANRYTKNEGLTKEQIEHAMRNTLSNNAAARYLGVNILTYRKYARMYFDEELGKDLYEKHKNWHGLGIPKGLKHNPEKEQTILMDILAGKVIPASFTAEKLRDRLIKEMLIKEECGSCGFNERRINDYKIPLLLSFRDGDKKNWHIDNLELLCYNCYFLQVGEVFNKKQIKNMQDSVRTSGGDVQKELQIEPTHMEILKDVYKNYDTFKPQDDDTGESLIYRV